MFIAYSSTVQYEIKGADTESKGRKAINQLIWGDYARIKTIANNWIEIRSRGRDGWVRKESLQSNRILEVNFVDIGQGDGCHIQTPNDKTIIIDAGEGDNMFRFLRWRFGKFNRRTTFESVIISHPDKDHYNGFIELFENPNLHIQTVYHNSIVEQVRGGKSSLGITRKVERKTYLTGLVQSKAQLEQITSSSTRRGKRLYPNMLRQAVDSGRVGDFIGLLADKDWRQPQFLPGYGPNDGNGMTLRLMGPVPKEIRPGQLALPTFSSTGKTKNGHSVVLILEIGSIKILLGGDLNEPSQEYLLEHYTGLHPSPKTPGEIERLVQEGRKHFEVDVAKACHHGSSDILPNFLRSTNPMITIISSGDDEPHSHPRPDTLGIVGKYSRSERPMIFSTELARSSKERIKHPNQVRQELKDSIDQQYSIINGSGTQKQKDAARDKLEELLQVIERSVANYGMINLRTDGNKMLITQRLERARSKSKRWDIYKFETDDHGRLNYIQ